MIWYQPIADEVCEVGFNKKFGVHCLDSCGGNRVQSLFEKSRCSAVVRYYSKSLVTSRRSC